MSIRIVTDSSADLSVARRAELCIEAVPLTLRIGEEEFEDGVDIDAAGFWARVRSSRATPRTTAPSPGAFNQAFTKAFREGATGIVCITLSSRVSAAHQSARLAAGYLDGHGPIAVVDSLSVSSGLGNLCIAAGRLAAEGADLKTVIAETERLRGRIAFYGALETLEYLRRGGRIGTARALLGTALSIRPLLRFEEGTVELAGKVNSRRRALDWIAQRLERDLPVEQVSLFHGDAPDSDVLHRRLASLLPGQPVDVTLMGPVMGTHMGPGCIGLTYYRALAPGDGTPPPGTR